MASPDAVAPLPPYPAAATVVAMLAAGALVAANCGRATSGDTARCKGEAAARHGAGGHAARGETEPQIQAALCLRSGHGLPAMANEILISCQI